MSERILVRGVNWIGDAVMTIPALNGIRRALPESKVSLLVRPSVAAIFEREPAVDEIILYDERFTGIIGKLGLAHQLRKRGFSKALLFQNAFDAALITFLAGIPARIGYDRDGRGFLLTNRIPFQDDDRKMHHIDYYLNLLKSAGIPVDYYKPNPPSPPFAKGEMGGFYPWIHLSLEERLAARSALSGLKRPLLGMNPGAAYGSAKRWFPERFAEVAGWFIRDAGGSVIIFGNKNEAGIAQEIEKHVRTQKSEVGIQNSEFRSSEMQTSNSLLNLSGKTSVRELISLISECDVFLTNDSGPLHIAYAVGTPLVAIFGSTDPGLTGPHNKVSSIIKEDFDCSPCFERTCKKGDMRCMYAITAEEVYLAIAKMLPDKRAVFLDRDGTLCEDVNYLSKWDDFRLLPGVDELVKLKEEGFEIIGITNQSGIARGLIDESFVKEIDKVFIERFGFDDFFYCPHRPEEYCSCRKPEPGMVFEARDKYGVDPRKSYMIGDKEIDMILAKSVGAKGIMVMTGQERASEYADFIVDNLHEAIKLVK